MEVTIALFLAVNSCDSMGARFSDFMKSTTPMRIRIRRFITDRYAYRSRPDFLPELIAFALVLVAVSWPMLLLANAFAATLK